MQWSKLKSRLIDFVAPELRKRVDFHLIKYRKLGDSTNEFLVVIDGVTAFSSSYSQHNIASHIVTRKTGMLAYGDGSSPHVIEKFLNEREIHAPQNITSSIRTYLDLDPHVSLNSSDPILRAFALLDKRIGKRTLTALKISENEHSLIRMFYGLRLESFNISPELSVHGNSSV